MINKELEEIKAMVKDLENLLFDLNTYNIKNHPDENSEEAVELEEAYKVIRTGMEMLEDFFDKEYTKSILKG